MIKEKQNVFKETKEKEIDEVELLKRLRRIRISNIWTVRIFFAVFFTIAVIAFIIPLRPTYSDTEKRELTKFPKFSVSALFSGEYFIDIDRWYSDTFPARDSITDLNARITMLFGKNDVQIHGEVEDGDEIPAVDETVNTDENDTSSKNNSADNTESNSEDATSNMHSSSTVSSGVSDNSNISVVAPPSQSGSQAQSGASSQIQSANSATQSVPPIASQSGSSNAPSNPVAPTTQTMGALLINGNTAYEYYNFSRETADRYTAVINRAGALLNGKAQVYDMIIPTSMGITAPESLVSKINTSNQRDAINYMSGKLQSSVKFVPLYDMLKSRSNEYIYFRTDHHWTALGAYYSYCELMKSMGEAPKPLESYIKYEFSGFLGSFYTSSGKLPQLAAKPDTVYAYQPPETNSMRILSNKGIWYDNNIISDMTTASASNKYITFLRGDNACSIIINPKQNNRKACVVVKESFGNAFVPFLVPHYQYLYVIDYRYFNKLDHRGLVQFQTDAVAQDVIFINNISATRNKTLVGYIDAFVR